MRPDRWSQTGAIGSRFQFGLVLNGWSIAAALLLAASTAFGAGYKDTAGAFTIAYDEAIWTIKSDADGDFSVDCAREACDGVTVGCSGSRLWVPLASVRRLMRQFDMKATEQTIVDGLAKEQGASETSQAKSDVEKVPPEVVKPYTLNYSRDGQPFYDSDYRASFGGRVTRFLSFSTGARSYSIAIVCHVPEDRIAVWRPRIDALIDGFKPAPDPFWLRWLAYIGL